MQANQQHNQAVTAAYEQLDKAAGDKNANVRKEGIRVGDIFFPGFVVSNYLDHRDQPQTMSDQAKALADFLKFKIAPSVQTQSQAAASSLADPNERIKEIQRLYDANEIDLERAHQMLRDEGLGQ